MDKSTSHIDEASFEPTRVGVILGELGKLNGPALKYLVLHLNTLQRTFEFEFLDIDPLDPLIAHLRPGEVVDRESCRGMLQNFHRRLVERITREQQDYNLVDRSIPDGFVLVTMARFSDEHYGLKSENVQVQAFGDWERHMAPPSIFEFIITLLLRQAASFRTASVSKSVHLGTKGCLFDFTAELGDARLKSLQAYICSTCRERLKTSGTGQIATDLIRALDMRWLGKLDDPYSPASIVSKLGYNLFITQGIKPTLRETIRASLRDEGTKEFVKLIFAVILSALLLWLGLKPK